MTWNTGRIRLLMGRYRVCPGCRQLGVHVLHDTIPVRPERALFPFR